MEKPNFSYIDKMANGDKSFRNKIVEVLKQELPEEINNYRNYMSQNDLKNAALFVHRIKHKMSILGLEKSYEITNSFENEMKSTGNLEKKEYFEKVLPLMKNFLENT